MLRFLSACGPAPFARVLTALSGHPEADGAVPVVPTPDTVKRVRDGWVVESIPRDELVIVVTRDGQGRKPRTGNGATAAPVAVAIRDLGFRAA